MAQKKRTLLKTLGSSVIGLGLASSVGSAQSSNAKESRKTIEDLPANEVAFAKRELPNYLEDTILDGSQRVVVTESGNPPEGMTSDNYDIAISHSESDKIENEAIENYKDQFNVDPSTPKVDIVNGTPMHVDEVQRRVEAGKIELSASPVIENSNPNFNRQSNENSVEPLVHDSSVESGLFNYLSSSGINSDGPDKSDFSNELHMNIIPASDSSHNPSESYRNDTTTAASIFTNEFGPDINYTVYFGYWDASDTNNNAGNLIDNLREFDENNDNLNNKDAEFTVGWVDEMSNNGIADLNGFFSVNACKATGVNWDHERIVQHEISHNFGAPDRGRFGYEHDKCIMNEEWAYRGIDYWCSEDHPIVDGNINYDD
jgi:hypothetical protein